MSTSQTNVNFQIISLTRHQEAKRRAGNIITWNNKKSFTNIQRILFKLLVDERSVLLRMAIWSDMYPLVNNHLEINNLRTCRHQTATFKLVNRISTSASSKTPIRNSITNWSRIVVGKQPVIIRISIRMMLITCQKSA